MKQIYFPRRLTETIENKVVANVENTSNRLNSIHGRGRYVETLRCLVDLKESTVLSTTSLLSNFLHKATIVIIGNNKAVKSSITDGNFGNLSEAFLARSNLDELANRSDDWSFELAIFFVFFDLWMDQKKKFGVGE